MNLSAIVAHFRFAKVAIDSRKGFCLRLERERSTRMASRVFIALFTPLLSMVFLLESLLLTLGEVIYCSTLTLSPSFYQRSRKITGIVFPSHLCLWSFVCAILHVISLDWCKCVYCKLNKCFSFTNATVFSLSNQLVHGKYLREALALTMYTFNSANRQVCFLLFIKLLLNNIYKNIHWTYTHDKFHI